MVAVGPAGGVTPGRKPPKGAADADDLDRCPARPVEPPGRSAVDEVIRQHAALAADGHRPPSAAAQRGPAPGAAVRAAVAADRRLPGRTSRRCRRGRTRRSSSGRPRSSPIRR